MTKLIVTWGFVIGFVILNAFGALGIKHVVNQKGAIPLTLKKSFFYFVELSLNPLFICSFIAIIGSALLYISALSRMDITVAYPVALAFNFVIAQLSTPSIFRRPSFHL